MSQPRSRRSSQCNAAVALIIEEPKWRNDSGVVHAIRKAARLALGAAPVRNRAGGEAISASILLSDDDRLKALNAAFRNKPKATNVLSFPAAPELAPYAGDIALAYQVVRRESVTQSKSLAAHAAHLTIHGILHLLGYDHEHPEDAEIMENLEISLLDKMRIANPYRPEPVRQRGRQPKLEKCLKVPAR